MLRPCELQLLGEGEHGQRKRWAVMDDLCRDPIADSPNARLSSKGFVFWTLRAIEDFEGEGAPEVGPG
jgi:hypothetical protein